MLLLFSNFAKGVQEGSNTVAHPIDDIPLSVRYGILFRQLTVPQDVAGAHDSTAQSSTATYAETLKNDTNLSSEQVTTVSSVAAECIRKLNDVDKRARLVIDEFRRQHPPGTLDPDKGLPPPPAELKNLKEERRIIIMQARDDLRAALGEPAFQQLDQYVRTHGNGRTFTFPQPNHPGIPVQSVATALDADGSTVRKQFHPGERIIVRMQMLNNSAQPIMAKQSDLDDWYQLILIKDGHQKALTMLPPQIRQRDTKGAAAPSTEVELQPGQMTTVGEWDLSQRIEGLEPGKYEFSAHPRVLLNRPPDKSEILVISGDPLNFEITRLRTVDR